MSFSGDVFLFWFVLNNLKKNYEFHKINALPLNVMCVLALFRSKSRFFDSKNYQTRIPLNICPGNLVLSYLPLDGVAVIERVELIELDVGNAPGPLTGLRMGVVGVFSRNAS